MANERSRFQRGSGVYTCTDCGKRTRETGSCESNCDLCLQCFEKGGMENTHNDGGHSETPDPNCHLCPTR